MIDPVSLLLGTAAGCLMTWAAAFAVVGTRAWRRFEETEREIERERAELKARNASGRRRRI